MSTMRNGLARWAFIERRCVIAGPPHPKGGPAKPSHALLDIPVRLPDCPFNGKGELI